MPKRKKRKALQLKEPTAERNFEEFEDTFSFNTPSWKLPYTGEDTFEEGIFVKCPSCGTVVEVTLDNPECPVCGTDLTEEINLTMRGEEDIQLEDEEEEF